MADKQTEAQSRLYEAFMVRIWRDSPQSCWRASVQLVADGGTINFGNLPALFEFLVLRSEKTAERHRIEATEARRNCIPNAKGHPARDDP